MQSFTEDLYKVIGIHHYKGCRIIPKDGKFVCGHLEFDTVQDAKDRIDDVCENLLNRISIINLK